MVEVGVTGLCSFTQLAMVKLVCPKLTAGILACAPDPLGYKHFIPSSSSYLAPSTRMFKE